MQPINFNSTLLLISNLLNLVWGHLFVIYEWPQNKAADEIAHLLPHVGNFNRNYRSFKRYYSNHLNTDHLKSEHSTFSHFFVQFLNGLITWLGRPVECQKFVVQFSDVHSKTGPFNNHRTCLVQLNTRLVWYSEGYCIKIYKITKILALLLLKSKYCKYYYC